MRAKAKFSSAPGLPLPAPTVSNVEGTWANDTMSRRIREEILQNMVIRDNWGDLSEASRQRLKEFVSELERTSEVALRPISEDGGFDTAAWNEIVEQHAGQSWLDASWVVTEYYFYRRVLEAVGYFRDELGDPFEKQKQNGLNASFPALKPLAKLMKQALSSGPEETEFYFKALLLTSLWGNRMDLSIWPAEEASDSESTARAKDAMNEVLASSSKMLLADHSDRVWKAAAASSASGSGRRFDIIADNAGFELITDLCLADFLVSSGLATKVVIHLKQYPVFVSDAMEKDVWQHIHALAGDEGVPEDMRSVASRWASMVEEGHWELRENGFWCLPLAFWEMPDDLKAHFEGSAMAIVKGDANYRRQIGERTWDFSTPFEEISSYWGCPVCCLRTMKSEVACGVSEADQKRAREEDSGWLVTGRYGVVHAKT
ncbi:DUF89 domain-containing protein [Chloropicon primus]|uniref:Sugar phosphate phosphatase n=1 Tax=Chloropicon primus TaxID=1764295 RepID=A0A5B8MGE9_9CHLO|nr:DUF89 domain-containing protein [Chloropicon primus]UPQ98677.1 DUF89 domain-containing protein [Chloropicon primus]|eukprot:QDZ19467.1 DUF89 domain-containing protein [Chloropicon primus]